MSDQDKIRLTFAIACVIAAITLQAFVIWNVIVYG